MAKTPAPAAPKAAKSTVTVIYRPLDIGDPFYIKWNGIRFDANVPAELDPKNPAHHIMQLMPIERVVDGEIRTKHHEQKMFMGDMAKANPSFEVDGKRAKRKVSTRQVPPPGAEWTEAHEGTISESDTVDVDATRAFMAA